MGWGVILAWMEKSKCMWNGLQIPFHNTVKRIL